jgi:hypothetical protein
MNENMRQRINEYTDERTLGNFDDTSSVRRPSYEMQQAAMIAGYGSVRDWALDQCIEEIRMLKDRVADLEADVSEVIEP